MQHFRLLSLLPALVLMLAGGAAHAVVLSSDAANFTFSAYRYAKATLKKAGSFPGTGDDASNTYYVVTENTAVTGALDLYFDAGLSANGSDTVLLHVTLTGMAFHDAISAHHADPDPANNFSLISGGQKGDTTATLRYTGNGFTDNSDANDAEDRITINIGTGNKLGITADHVGGVEVKLVNATLEKILGAGKATTTVTQARAVEGVPMHVQIPLTPLRATARALHGFEAFDGGGTHRAALAVVTYDTPPAGKPRQADGGEIGTSPTYYHQQAYGPTTRARLLGDLSFAEKVVLLADIGVNDDEATLAACPTATGLPTNANSWPIAEDGMMTEWLEVTNAGNWVLFFPDPDTVKFVCIEAKADTAIPEASYRVEIEYAPPTGTTAAELVSPIPNEIFEIGSIRRDGTTIHLPYVSTHEKYNQRFLIVNNGPAVTYEFTFTPESGVDAEPGTKASGTLAKGTTHLKASEVVTLTGGSRTAATFSAAADPGNIEMSSVLVSRTKGETDLSVLQAEE